MGEGEGHAKHLEALRTNMDYSHHCRPDATLLLFLRLFGEQASQGTPKIRSKYWERGAGNAAVADQESCIIANEQFSRDSTDDDIGRD